MTSAAVTILLLLYWGNDGRSAMTSVEFSSPEACEKAKRAASKAMDGFSGRTYGTCTPK